MAQPASACLQQAPLIAILVMVSPGATSPSPFFNKCDGFLVLDRATGAVRFHRNEFRTSAGLCDQLLKSRATVVICGFIAEMEQRRLAAADIIVRICSCACCVGQLMARAGDLPYA